MATRFAYSFWLKAVHLILSLPVAVDAQANFPQERMYSDRSIIRLSKGKGQTVMANLGERFSLAGDSVTQVERYLSWRQMLLWFGLLLGVAFVSFMATKVVRELKTQ